MFWFQYQYMEWDLYRNNTLSSILWTTTFACAKLICQIKKCQTYFHTSTLPILLLEQRELMTKVHECAEFHFFFVFSREFESDQNYWILGSCLLADKSNKVMLPCRGHLSCFEANFNIHTIHFYCKNCSQVWTSKSMYTYLPAGYLHRYIPNIEGIERCSTFFLYWAFYKKYSLLSFSGRGSLFMGTQYSYQ